MSNWLIGVTAAAMLAAVARCLMPAGAVQQVGSLVCAMMMLWAVLSPLTPLSGTVFRDFDFAGQIQGQETELKQKSEQLMKTLIEQECGTYIVDKAEQMGARCQADVVCRMGEDGVWLPAKVCIAGDLTGQQRGELERIIEEELGIDREHQQYLGGG